VSNQTNNPSPLSQIGNSTANRQIYSGDPSSVNFGKNGSFYNGASNIPGGAVPDNGMLDCPTELNPGQIPDGFIDYGKPAGSALFHCGYDGIKEDRTPTGPNNPPQQECFYDEDGNIVDENHEYAMCGGTPNQYDADANPIEHTFLDSGGIVQNGLQGIGESIHHGFDNAVDTVQHGFNNAVDTIQEGFENFVDRFTDDDPTPTPAPTPEPTPTVDDHKSSADERQEEEERRGTMDVSSPGGTPGGLGQVHG